MASPTRGRTTRPPWALAQCEAIVAFRGGLWSALQPTNLALEGAHLTLAYAHGVMGTPHEEVRDSEGLALVTLARNENAQDY